MLLRHFGSHARKYASQLPHSATSTQLCIKCTNLAPKVSPIPSYNVNRSMSSNSDEKLHPRGDLGRRNFEPMPEEPDDLFETEEREFIDMTVEDFSELYQNNEPMKDFIKKVLAEYEVLKYETIGRVPSVITKKDMIHFIEGGKTFAGREKIFRYLFVREMDKRASIRKKLRDKKARELEKLSTRSDTQPKSGLLDENGDICYGLWHNSLFARIPNHVIKTGLSGSRLRNASLFGRKVIFDLSYEMYMSKTTIRNLTEQLQEAIGLNRFDYKEPFDVWFCNYNGDSYTAQYLVNNAMTNLHTNSMITLKPGCMTEYFDKSKLVYLSPNAKDPLGQVVKSDDIYIIGAYNDRGNSMPISLRVAKKLGIRARRLPLDEHVLWKGTKKALCINHVLGILLEVMSNGNDWKKAFLQHVPARKMKPKEQAQEEEAYRQSKLKSMLVRKHMNKNFFFD